jgi:hypothetical protein
MGEGLRKNCEEKQINDGTDRTEKSSVEGDLTALWVVEGRRKVGGVGGAMGV